MKWSKFQQAIFRDTSEGKGHTIVEASAGSGKSSTLLESLNYIPKNASWLIVAFNKRIADDMKRKAGTIYNGDIRTLHSLGLRACSKRWPKIRIDQDKKRKFFDKKLNRNQWDIKMQLSKTVSLCKGYLIEGAEFIDHIMDNHDIDCGDYPRDKFIDLVQACMESSKKNVRSIDYDDMIWMPHVHNIYVQKYDRVMIDEGQDLNAAQTALSLRACKKNGRITVYADQNQAIYSFAGATLNSVDKIKSKLKAKSLPLSITYRCPILVVKEANKLVDTIEARPGAPQGIVETITKAQLMKKAKPGCFILSRANAPMIGIALAFIKAGIPASIQGRDIGANLINLIKKSRRKTLPSFLKWLDVWEKRETLRMLKKHGKTDTIKDKAACIRAIADSSHDLNAVKNTIKDLFEDTDDKDRVILSTAHRAKGAERDVVFMLMPTFKTYTQEERNIYYVALTRSKMELYMVS